MTVASQPAASELTQWFESVQRLVDGGLFAVAPPGPHRDAVALDALRRNARILSAAVVDKEGKLYQPLCYFLAAACRQLRLGLNHAHWRAALDNVRGLKRQLESAASISSDVGLEVGGPAELFKNELDEAIRQTGLVDGASFLSKEERQVALGLAVNWGIRFLLAYALEAARPDGKHAPKDLWWLADQTSAALSGPA